MSLIHDAIRRAERDALTQAPGMSRALSLGSAPGVWGRPVAFALAGAIGLSTLAWAHWQRASPRTTVVTGLAQPAAMVVTPVQERAIVQRPVAFLPVSVQAVTSRAPPSLLAQQPSTVPRLQSPALAAVAAVAEVSPAAPRQPAENNAQTVIAAPAKAVEAVTTQRPTAIVDVQQLLHSFVKRMKAGDITQAKAELQAIQAKTPALAAVRMRAEAWYALGSGDVPGARVAYQQLLDRFPGDEEASINLASIETGANQLNAARTTLADALRNNPDSDALRNALHRFNTVERH